MQISAAIIENSILQNISTSIACRCANKIFTLIFLMIKHHSETTFHVINLLIDICQIFDMKINAAIIENHIYAFISTNIASNWPNKMSKPMSSGSKITKIPVLK